MSGGARAFGPSVVPAEFSGEPALQALWEQVLMQWDNEEAHNAFLEAASTEGNLAFAAVLYRKQKDDDAQRAPLADRQLAQITALAMASIDASHSAAPQPRRMIALIAFILSMALLGACFYAITQ